MVAASARKMTDNAFVPSARSRRRLQLPEVCEAGATAPHQNLEAYRASRWECSQGFPAQRRFFVQGAQRRLTCKNNARYSSLEQSTRGKECRKAGVTISSQRWINQGSQPKGGASPSRDPQEVKTRHARGARLGSATARLGLGLALPYLAPGQRFLEQANISGMPGSFFSWRWPSP